jgi:hypothetical protein
MRALAYLLITQMKNRILSLRKKPGLLILYSFVFIFVVASVIVMLVFGNDMEQMDFADERILLLILAGISIFFLYLFVVSGLSTGSSLFTMPDVGLLFVAPISSKKILLYGLISTLGKAMIGSLFIFYQIGNLKSNFGYGFREIFALFLIFTLMMLFYQLLAIGIYIFSNGNSVRKNIVKVLMYAVFAVILLGVLLIQRQEQSGIFETVLQVVDSNWFGYIPGTGWSIMFFTGIIHYSLPSVALALGFFFVFGILIVALLTSGRADYYEDVLLSTEVTYQTKLAAKEGRNNPRRSRKKIKVRDNEQGIGYGTGASAIMYKHILEMKRRSRFIFIDNFTVFLTLGAGFVGYNFRNKEGLEMVSYVILAIAIYLQYFMSMMGKLSFELIKPYIFMIPEKSFKKVIAASATSLLKPCIDGLIAFMTYAIISGAGPLIGFFYGLAYAASGAVFIGMTILYQRVLGGQPNRLVRAFIGIGLLFAIMSPSIGVSVVAAYMLPEALKFLSMLPYTIFCVMFAAILFLTCGNLIDKAEFTGKA